MEEECKCEEGAPGWMVTFADLSTLLLTFFVLLLSFANMDVIKFRELMGSVRNAFGYQTVSFGNWNPAEVSDDPAEETAYTEQGSGGVEGELETLMEIQKNLESMAESDSVEAESSPRGIVVRVKDNIMFRPGTDQLKRSAESVLSEVANILGQFPCEIMVEGHTDDAPINTAAFPSNWELSSKRAIQVMRFLGEIGGFAPERLAAAGYADTRPIGPNDTEVNRSKNRRVEFVCVRDNDTRRRESERINELAEMERLRRRVKSGRKAVNRPVDLELIEIDSQGATEGKASENRGSVDAVAPEPKRNRKKRRRQNRNRRKKR